MHSLFVLATNIITAQRWWTSWPEKLPRKSSIRSVKMKALVEIRSLCVSDSMAEKVLRRIPQLWGVPSRSCQLNAQLPYWLSRTLTDCKTEQLTTIGTHAASMAPERVSGPSTPFAIWWSPRIISLSSFVNKVISIQPRLLRRYSTSWKSVEFMTMKHVKLSFLKVSKEEKPVTSFVIIAMLVPTKITTSTLSSLVTKVLTFPVTTRRSILDQSQTALLKTLSSMYCSWFDQHFLFPVTISRLLNII